MLFDAKIMLTKMTPDLAKTLCKTSIRDLKPREQWVKQLARIMRQGKFKTDYDLITISRDGHLLNGLHRLLAVVKSGVSVKMYMCRLDKDYVTKEK